jgi:hypothetical protein
VQYVWILNRGVRDNASNKYGGTLSGGLGFLLGVGLVLVAAISACMVGLHLFGILSGDIRTQIPEYAPALAIACILAIVFAGVLAYRAARAASAGAPLRLVQHVAMITVAALLGYATVAMATYGALALNAVLTDRYSPLLADVFASAALLAAAVGIVWAWPKGRVLVGLLLAATLGTASALGLSGTEIEVF